MKEEWEYSYFCNELISDIGVVEPSPEFKGHSTITPSSYEFPLHGKSLGQSQGVSGLMGKGWARDTEGHVSTIGLE